MSSSPPPESGIENQAAEATPNSGHRKEASASPESGPGKEAAKKVIPKPVKAEAAAAAKGEVGGAQINIRITSQTTDDVFMLVKRNILMQRIMDQYCGRQSLHPKAVVFLHDGLRIKAAQTAEEAGLEDGSEISVHLRQDGGSGRF